MSHLLILCEGDTENRVLKPFLRPYWQKRFTTVEVQKYDGGGDLRINFKADTEQQLTHEMDSSVLCLVDLYEEPFGIYHTHRMTADEGYKYVREHMYRQISTRFHQRFGAFPVVMELETWLLADPIVQRHFDESILEPESVAHPCGFLERVYRSRRSSYRKIIDGVSLFGKADAIRVYDDNCPHFNELADWLANEPPKPDRSPYFLAKIEQWETQRDEKYNLFVQLEHAIQTDVDLDAAIHAEQEFYSHLSTYQDLFKE